MQRRMTTNDLFVAVVCLLAPAYGCCWVCVCWSISFLFLFPICCEWMRGGKEKKVPRRQPMDKSMPTRGSYFFFCLSEE